MLKNLLTTFLSGSILIQGMCVPVLADAASEPLKDTSSENQNIEMYRLYNRSSGEHFYTHDLNEKDTLVGLGWKYEGIGWYAPVSSQTPVYRLYNKNAGDHHYTTDKNEKDTLIKLGWNDEGIRWYSDDSETIPLYRQYNPNAQAGSHNYTTSQAENDSLCSIGWKAEGIGWYALKEGEPILEKNYEEAYRPILDKVKTIIINKSQGNYDSSISWDFIGLIESDSGSSLNDFGYVIQDFSGDGIPELAIVCTKYPNILNLYTLVNDKPSLIFNGWVRSAYAYAGGSSFITSGSNGAAYSVLGVFSLSKDGQNIIYNEFYYTEPSSSLTDLDLFFNTTGIASAPSEYVGGSEAYFQISKRIHGMEQSLNSIPLSHWK